MEEKQLTEQESMQLINRMIHEAKGYYYEDGTSSLVYGFSVFACAVLSYLLDKRSISLPFNPFYSLIPIFFVQGWIQNKLDKKKKAKTFTDEAIDYVWVGFFLSAILSLSGLFAGLGYLVISIILMLIGFACFLTGMISKFRYHVFTAVVCLVLAAISFFIKNENSYLLLGAIAILVWVIPGFILRAKFKEIQQTEKE